MKHLAAIITVIMTSAVALSLFVLEARSIEPQAACLSSSLTTSAPSSICTKDQNYILLN